MTINRNCILRLSHYKNALYDLQKIGFKKAFSDNIADATGETAGRVRKDFSLFGITGNKKGGYIVTELLNRLNQILGKSEIQKVIIVGAGKIGTALMEYHGLKENRFEVTAGFDIDPGKIESAGDVQILPMSVMNQFIQSQEIKIGILTVPASAAQEVADQMIDAGIEAILNFAPGGLKVPEQVNVSNINVSAELENLAFFVNVSKNMRFVK